LFLFFPSSFLEPVLFNPRLPETYRRVEWQPHPLCMQGFHRLVQGLYPWCRCLRRHSR
jgi:hypothetical protein